MRAITLAKGDTGTIRSSGMSAVSIIHTGGGVWRGAPPSLGTKIG